MSAHTHTHTRSKSFPNKSTEYISVTDAFRSVYPTSPLHLSLISRSRCCAATACVCFHHQQYPECILLEWRMYTFCNPSSRLLMRSIHPRPTASWRCHPSKTAPKWEEPIRQRARCKQALSISPKKILKDYSIGFIRVMTEEANLRPARQPVCESG